MILKPSSQEALNALTCVAIFHRMGLPLCQPTAGLFAVPWHALRRAMRPLVLAGLIDSYEKPFRFGLSHAAARFTLLDVVEAADGPVRGETPLLHDPDWQPDELDKQLAAICDEAAGQVRQRLAAVTLTDLLSWVWMGPAPDGSGEPGQHLGIGPAARRHRAQ